MNISARCAVRTALDSSVILDVVVADPAHAAGSEAALRRAADEGALVLGECVLAEIRPAFASGDIEEFLEDWNIVFAPSTRESSLLAGKMFEAYLKRRRPGPRRVVADFLIGAHAQLTCERLLARDRGYFRDYFSKLTVMEP
jgi:predicted nucleic acid-binding protein